MNNASEGKNEEWLSGQQPATPTPVSQPQPSMLRKVFIGRDGLRAGWSLLIFIAMVAALAFCANRIGHKLHTPDPNSMKPGFEMAPLFGIIGEAVPFVIVLFATWVMSKSSAAPFPSTALATAECSRTSLPAWHGELPVSRS